MPVSLPASVWSVIGSVWQVVWPILVAVLLFGLVIFLHEFGHFFFAKLFKVKVNEFAIGFGPTLLKHQWGETTYALRLLPFGGFCAMEGEDETSEAEGSFSSKPVWKRLIIVVAGALNNLILGLVLMGLLIGISGGYGTREVALFTENASSQASGLQVGDEILRINGRAIFCATDISYMLMNSREPTVDMVVRREGEKVTLPRVTFQTEEVEGHEIIALDFKVVGQKTSITRPLSFLKEAVLETVSLGRLVWMSLFDILTGRYGLRELMGPVGIINETGKALQMGLENVLYILALLTVNLGIVNLLPLPAVDGGRVVFLLIEGIRRKPVPQKFEGWVHAAGLVVLLLFSVVIMGNDIWRLIRGG